MSYSYLPTCSTAKLKQHKGIILHRAFVLDTRNVEGTFKSNVNLSMYKETDAIWCFKLFLKWWCAGRFLTQRWLREKSIRVTWQSIYCVVRIRSLFKVVQHVAATNVALKIVCRRHVTRIDFLCNNVVLKIVVKNRPITFMWSKITPRMMPLQLFQFFKNDCYCQLRTQDQGILPPPWIGWKVSANAPDIGRSIL